MDELLDYFKERNVAIQITLDIGENPTVHAIHEREIFRTEATTIKSALERMKYKLFGE